MSYENVREHPGNIAVSKPGGRLLRITLNSTQAEGLRTMARHHILGGKASDVAKHLLMEALIEHAWVAYPQIPGHNATRNPR